MRVFARSIGLGLLTILSYWGFTEVYFQQEEWHGFGRVIYAQAYGLSSLIRQSGSHLTPLTTLLMAWLYTTFGLNHVAYAWFSLLLHLVNGFLVFQLGKLMFRQIAPAWIAATVFLFHAPASQAVTWYAASMAFLPSAFFSLIALLAFEHFLIHKKIHLSLFASFLVLVAAGFRENAVFLLAYMLLRTFLVRPELLRKAGWRIVPAGALYIFLRFLPTVIPSIPVFPYKAAPVTWLTILRQTVTFELLYLPKVLFPEFMLRQGIKMLPMALRAPNTIELLVVAFYGTLLVFSFLAVTIILKKLRKNKATRQLVLSLLGFLGLSILPFTLLPLPLIIEPRHLYLTGIGFSLLFGLFLHRTHGAAPAGKKWLSRLFFVLFLIVNIYAIRLALAPVIQSSLLRRTIVIELRELAPVLPKQTLLYATGDPLPLQTGMGHMFMVIHKDKQPYEKHLYEKFLGGSGDQGYKEIEGTGFGYFMDKNELLRVYCANNFLPHQVFAVSWNLSRHSFRDTSQAFRITLSCTPPRSP